MTGQELLNARKRKGWEQAQSAASLGVSQPYLSLLEQGKRRVSEKLARRAAKLYQLPETTLPVKSTTARMRAVSDDTLAQDLAALDYQPFAHYKTSRRKKNPADILLTALKASNLESRLVEALPWLVLQFPDMDWRYLASAAKLHDLQNRLGFITNVARRVAENAGDKKKAAFLKQKEKLLEPSRLAREDTLCHDSLTEAEKRWLRQNRSAEAKHWNLLTDLSPEHLNYDG